ncbi:MAG: MOFRL family protein, partial [Candidatus Ranarchaeia archaeon]
FWDMQQILRRYNLLERIPSSVRQRLEQGIRGEVPETVKDPKYFKGGFNVIIGNIRMACEAALRSAQKKGVDGEIVSTTLSGEAREVGERLAKQLNSLATVHSDLLPYALVFGGETTVTVRGRGKGGRNQELAVAGARLLKAANTFLASVATDGVDGNVPVAGGIIDWKTIRRAKKKGLDVEHYLRNNDCYSFLKSLGDIIVTGATGTNVMDLQILLALKENI